MTNFQREKKLYASIVKIYEVLEEYELTNDVRAALVRSVNKKQEEIIKLAIQSMPQMKIIASKAIGEK